MWCIKYFIIYFFLITLISSFLILKQINIINYKLKPLSLIYDTLLLKNIKTSRLFKSQKEIDENFVITVDVHPVSL
jgi:hypothetical protein